MGRLISGEYTPPRELVAIGAARVSGRGSIQVSEAGLAFEGTIHGGGPPVSPLISLLLLAAGLAIFALVPSAERALAPLTALAAALLLWLRYRADFGRSGTFSLSWSEIEHAVRLASAPDVLAIVLSRPISGRGSPEQVFFSPTLGVEELVAAMREHAPQALTIDTESALAQPATHASEESSDLWP